MAGHSKFKNIMYRKGAQDKKRAKLFAKLAKEITVAAKMGIPDPDHNPRLRAAIQAARGQSMPKDNIERAVKKSTEQGGDDYMEIRYEGFGPAGVGVMVEALTDNKNRTASDVRSIFSKNGGNLGETGSVSFLFERVGSIEFSPGAGDADAFLDASIEAGADDCDSDDDGHMVTCGADSLHEVAQALEEKFGEPRVANLIWKPCTMIEVADEKVETLLGLIEALDDNDDVQQVYANFEVSDSAMEKISA